MKRLILFALVFLAVLVLPPLSAEAYTPATASIGTYNTDLDCYDYQSYNLVGLTDKGQAMETDMPAFIMDSRTLVPVRVISEAIGAKVGWIGETRQVTVDCGDLSVVLTIGSSAATVNGEKIELPDGVPATLAKYDGVQRTLVPLRFVAEVLGASVEWDAGSYTVHINKPAEQREPYELLALTADNEAGTLTIETGDAPEYTVKYYSGRLIIDLFDAKLTKPFVVPYLSGTGINDVRISQYTGYEDEENVVRVVCELKRGVTYPETMSVADSGSSIVLTGNLPDEDAGSGSEDEQEEEEEVGFTVVVDPGHGGSDPGASSGGFREADINLAVALKVRDKLEQAGINVVMTRTEDVYVSLSDRSEIANATNADLYVSIHVNASDSVTTAKGVETYCLQSGGWGEILAGCIQDAILANTGAVDRGVKEANFFVLRETSMPAALAELGFITTPEERARLTDPSYQELLADGIAQGTLDCLEMMIS